MEKDKVDDAWCFPETSSHKPDRHEEHASTLFNPFDLLSDTNTTQPCTFYLISTPDLAECLTKIHHISPAPLLTARVMGWIITPTHLSVPELTSTNWDLFLVHNSNTTTITAPPLDLAPLLGPSATKTFQFTAHVPTALLANFASRNHRLLHPSPSSSTLPPLTGSLDNPARPGFFAPDAQPLKMTAPLWRWFEAQAARPAGRAAVSMLNLLAMAPGRESRALYRAYGKGFHEGAGARRGGVAKLVGRVEGDLAWEGEGGVAAATATAGGWEEVAVAHYPSLWHFADMVAGEDYQALNDRYRIPALRDTLILCTTEVVLQE